MQELPKLEVFLGMDLWYTFLGVTLSWADLYAAAGDKG